MKAIKMKPLDWMALVCACFPIVTLIPVALSIALPDGVRMVWAGANIISALAGSGLSALCLKFNEERNLVNIISLVIGTFWILLVVGMLALALVLNLLQ